MKIPYNQGFFNNIAQEFDAHVKQSIPLFGRVQQNIAINVASMYAKSKVLDICGSTGELGRQLLYNGWDGEYVCLDGSPQMREVFENVTPEGSKDELKFLMAGFQGEWVDEYKWKKYPIPYYEPSRPDYDGGYKFDFAIEVLGFQFFTKEREKEILAMKKLAPVCIFFEKFTTDNEDIFRRNEARKAILHKSLFFTKDQIEAKKEEVLDDMGDYLYNGVDFNDLIRKHFSNVVRIARIGNFAGYVASDQPINWIKDSGLLTNRFTVVGTY